MEFADKLYDVLKEETEGFDAIYENYIVDVIGRRGLQILFEKGMIQICGAYNGRRMYVLVEKKE